MNVQRVLNEIAKTWLSSKINKPLKDLNCIKNTEDQSKYLKKNHIYRILSVELSRMEEFRLFYHKKLKKITILHKIKMLGMQSMNVI